MQPQNIILSIINWIGLTYIYSTPANPKRLISLFFLDTVVTKMVLESRLYTVFTRLTFHVLLLLLVLIHSRLFGYLDVCSAVL